MILVCGFRRGQLEQLWAIEEINWLLNSLSQHTTNRHDEPMLTVVAGFPVWYSSSITVCVSMMTYLNYGFVTQMEGCMNINAVIYIKCCYIPLVGIKTKFITTKLQCRLQNTKKNANTISSAINFGNCTWILNTLYNLLQDQCHY